MPYDNELNRKIALETRQNLIKKIHNFPMSYDVAESNLGYTRKDYLDESGANAQSSINKLKESGEDIRGGALGSVAGFAKGTVRDTGFGKTLGAGKKRQKKTSKTNSKKSSKSSLGDVKTNKKVVKKEKSLLLTRQLEGGNVGLLDNKGRPSKMKGGTDLAKPYNMIKPDGTTGSGKPVRPIGGAKLVPVANMHSSSMSGQGKKKRSDIVKEVMKKRGVGMIEASKIVKNENLY